MKEVRSSSRKCSFKLSPQHSATDTSSWEDGNVSAPTISKIAKRHTVGEPEFIRTATPGIPPDNNKAERMLRKLVIKRKKSFRVKLKGARTLEALLSVCQSLYNRDKDNFLVNLHGLAMASE